MREFYKYCVDEKWDEENASHLINFEDGPMYDYESVAKEAVVRHESYMMGEFKNEYDVTVLKIGDKAPKKFKVRRTFLAVPVKE